AAPCRSCRPGRPRPAEPRRPGSRAGPTRHSDETALPDSPALKERAMSQTLTDSTVAEVTVALDEDSRSYAIAVEGGAIAGHAYFLPGPEAETERSLHHTVVVEQFVGRGLTKVLVAEALADSRESGITVVPICPLFVKKLQQTGDDYQAEGGRFRNATGADFDIVKKQA